MIRDERFACQWKDSMAQNRNKGLIDGRFRRVGLGLVLVALALVMPGGVTRAGTPDPCTGIDSRWYTTGHDQPSTTSHCLGNPITPHCAIDTLHAAILRGDLHLFTSVAPLGLEDFFDEDMLRTNTKGFHDNKYFHKIIFCKVLTANDHLLAEWGPSRPGMSQNRDQAWYPGDILLKEIFELCDAKQSMAACFQKSPDHAPSISILRRLDSGHWRLVNWKAWDNIFPIQGHVGPPCRPEDQGLRLLTDNPATTTSQCLGGDQTPLCAAETYLEALLAGARDEHNYNRAFFLRYKLLDCEVLDDKDSDPNRWDPRPYRSPMVRGAKVGIEGSRKAWKAGDIRIGIRIQICNGTDNTCWPTKDMIGIYRDYSKSWQSISYWIKKNTSDKFE